MSKMEALKENIIRYFDHLFESKLHDNSHSDYNNVIESIGDYCVERIQEIDHKDRMIYFVVDGMAMRCIIKEAMDNHLKECHPQTKKVDAAWFANTRCFIHNVGIKAIEDDEILEFQCGCRFQRKRGI